jgi:hypothetical protein
MQPCHETKWLLPRCERTTHMMPPPMSMNTTPEKASALCKRITLLRFGFRRSERIDDESSTIPSTSEIW